MVVPPFEEMASQQTRGDEPSDIKSKKYVNWFLVCARIYHTLFVSLTHAFIDLIYLQLLQNSLTFLP
jgi:hypothetical protein